MRTTLVNDRASADAIAGRVRAVSSANDLVNQSDEKTVPLPVLLSLEFAPNPETRLQTSGPDVEVSSDAARKLGLVFHELVTNAMKHGALANPDGRVAVDWQADGRIVHLDLARAEWPHGFTAAAARFWHLDRYREPQIAFRQHHFRLRSEGAALRYVVRLPITVAIGPWNFC